MTSAFFLQIFNCIDSAKVTRAILGGQAAYNPRGQVQEPSQQLASPATGEHECSPLSGRQRLTGLRKDVSESHSTNKTPA